MANDVRRCRPLLGTLVEIAVSDPPSAHVDTAIDAAFAAIQTVHRLMSFHEAGSDLSRLNLHAYAAPVLVDGWTCQVLEACVDLHRRSQGRFDVAVAPVLETMGILPVSINSRRSKFDGLGLDSGIVLLPGCYVGFKHSKMRIDLGGIAKGFAVDRAVEILKRHGISGGLVNAGGDIAAFGTRAYTIDIRNPADPSRIICQVALENEAIASTGAAFDPFASSTATSSAIIDPATGAPVSDLSGASVRAPSCMIADALTKIVMISGEQAAPVLAQFNASALAVTASGDAMVTPDWHGALTLAA